MTRIALLAAALLLATAPTAAAVLQQPAGCSFALWFWHANYDCHVLDAGADGTVVWCPSAPACADGLLIACSFQNYPYWYCTTLP